VRRVLLEHLQRYRERCAFWFADQQVNVFRHDHVSGDEESVPSARAFESVFEDFACMGVRQQRVTMMTAEGYEVEASCLLETPESPRHVRHRS
jgi:hypothetical protein